MIDPDDFERWKRETWDAMAPEERQRIIDARREYKRSMRQKKYEDYLLSDQWALLRRLKIEEAKGLCEVCGKRDPLQIHHRSYERLYRESLSDLTALCDACHEQKQAIASDDRDGRCLASATPSSPACVRW